MRQPALLDSGGYAEVAEHYLAVAVDQYIGALDISVNDVKCMQVLQAIYQHLKNRRQQNFILNAILELLVQHGAHASHFNERHYDPEVFVVHERHMIVHYTLVVALGHDVDLVASFLHGLAGCQLVKGEDFDCDRLHVVF